jgi:hypothetical protein
MTEQELRALVRQAIARAQGGPPATNPSPRPWEPTHAGTAPSHALFVIPDGSDADGPCIIEPAVPCNHCGYCKSMGH